MAATWIHRLFDGTATQAFGSFALAMFVFGIASWAAYCLVRWTVRDVLDELPATIRGAWRAIAGRPLPRTCIGLRHGCRCEGCRREMDSRR